MGNYNFWDIYIYVKVIMGGLQGGQGGQDGLPHHRQPHPHHRVGEGEIQKVKKPKLCNTCLGRMVRWWTTLGHGSRPTKTISR